MVSRLIVAATCLLVFGSAVFAAERPLFDGKSFAGWEGEIAKTWRIEDGVIVGGSLETKVPRNEFLATKIRFRNFDLRVKYKLQGTEGFVNGGVQFRSERIPNHHEMIGYQADIGQGYDGALYDESRRNKFLIQPESKLVQKVLKPNDWNDYRIRAEGARVRIWLNGVEMIDFTEQEPGIAQDGLIALQVHGGGKALISFKEIVIEELP
ncbi:3-keto-disaccharide hydrolase [Planctomicrobium sp. SH527]|uniref:3-keto-disaccharide hydrolase n=1 Tax=Planctomicrobium sp. SH527 TaxID=3448123 RepID=UPI003F5C115F